MAPFEGAAGKAAAVTQRSEVQAAAEPAGVVVGAVRAGNHPPYAPRKGHVLCKVFL